MNLTDYQREAQLTDRNPGPREKAILIPLLGLAGEIGTLLSEYKKLLRDGSAHERFRLQVEEELGDVLWYTANLATKFGISLERAATLNLEKTRSRWLLPQNEDWKLLDEDFPPEEQLPRTFRYRFEYRVIAGCRKVVLLGDDAAQLGDPLTDNAYQDDGYRFHDVLHLAFAAMLGWSPVFRRLLRRKRKSSPQTDEVEDGARAAIIEELIAAVVFEYADRHRFLEGTKTVDWELLRVIRRLTANLEVSVRNEAEWERAIVSGLRAWKLVRDGDGGALYGDLREPNFLFAAE